MTTGVLALAMSMLGYEAMIARACCLHCMVRASTKASRNLSSLTHDPIGAFLNLITKVEMLPLCDCFNLHIIEAFDGHGSLQE